MTEAEQFLTEFLGVQGNDFPITLNLRLYGEAMEAYVAHVEKKKADKIINAETTNDTMEAYWRIVTNKNSITDEAFSKLVTYGKAEVEIYPINTPTLFIDADDNKVKRKQEDGTITDKPLA